VDAILNVNGGRITIGAYTFFGHGVMLLTGSHDAALRGQRRRDEWQGLGGDIVIGAGVWVASGAIIVGPVTIGDDAVVAAGSLVVDDVPAATLVAGRPAKVVRAV
jgi:acetyltransferase-like isoleucine patch superfamily enzyme